MNNNTKNYLLGALAVLIVVVLVLVGSNNDSSVVTETGNNTTVATTTTTVPKTTTTPKTTTPAPKVETFTNIFPQRGNYKCTYEEVTPSTRSTNVLYFSDGKMRVEFRTLGGSSNIMVYDGMYMYNWVEGQGTGVMSRPTSISDFPAIIPKDITEGVVLGSGLNSASWDCHAWAKDTALVNKPSYVKF